MNDAFAIYGDLRCLCALSRAASRFPDAAGVEWMFRARWSAHITDEWKRNLLDNRPDLTAEQLDRL